MNLAVRRRLVVGRKYQVTIFAVVVSMITSWPLATYISGVSSFQQFLQYIPIQIQIADLTFAFTISLAVWLLVISFVYNKVS